MPPGRLPGKGDLIRVSAKAGNVFPHPAERSYLIFQAQIDDAFIHVVKIAEGAEPIREMVTTTISPSSASNAAHRTASLLSFDRYFR